VHIQTIGAITEQRLWDSGLKDWDAFSDDLLIPLSGKCKFLLQNGKSFDIPFIESFFNIRLNHAQIDLRYVFLTRI
jgi:hypothetical protein